MATKGTVQSRLGLDEPVHLMGIAGAGMSALAELLVDWGIRVTGCDRAPSARLADLRAKGIEVWIGHDEGDHAPTGTVVHTAAVRRDHPELRRARARSLVVIPRSVVLARLTRVIPCVCVAGSHGKSTVTALLAHILGCAGLEPGCLVGGVVCGRNRGGFLGAGRMAVLETDEFDRTIERVLPHLGVITNVEPEHLDVYGHLRALAAAFDRFAFRSRLAPIVWGEGPGGFAPHLAHRSVRCGMGVGDDVRVEVRERDGLSHRILLHIPGHGSIDARLGLPGSHNIANAAVAAAGAWALGVAPKEIAEGLATYPGLKRRYETLATVGPCAVITDYAHHPTEIRATLETATLRGVPVIAVFQPHLYSRTALLFEDFARSFSSAARVLVTPIYAARESPIAGASSAGLADAVRAQGTDAEFVPDHQALARTLAGLIRSPSTVVFLSAGDLDDFARSFAQGLTSGDASARSADESGARVGEVNPLPHA